jgi:hypothetical protein
MRWEFNSRLHVAIFNTGCSTSTINHGVDWRSNSDGGEKQAKWLRSLLWLLYAWGQSADLQTGESRSWSQVLGKCRHRSQNGWTNISRNGDESGRRDAPLIHYLICDSRSLPTPVLVLHRAPSVVGVLYRLCSPFLLLTRVAKTDWLGGEFALGYSTVEQLCCKYRGIPAPAIRWDTMREGPRSLQLCSCAADWMKMRRSHPR